jgi:hypothetical protein
MPFYLAFFGKPENQFSVRSLDQSESKNTGHLSKILGKIPSKATFSKIYFTFLRLKTLMKIPISIKNCFIL